MTGAWTVDALLTPAVVATHRTFRILGLSRALSAIDSVTALVVEPAIAVNVELQIPPASGWHREAGAPQSGTGTLGVAGGDANEEPGRPRPEPHEDGAGCLDRPHDVRETVAR